MSIESRYDVGFMARLTAEEKQIQQNYRPIIGVHKWFARRPGSLFRGLLVSEFGGERPLSTSYYQSQDHSTLTILDPFMGGGTTLFEAVRIGCNVIGCDTNTMAAWIVRQELDSLDRHAFMQQADGVVLDVEEHVQHYYSTECVTCNVARPVKYFLWVKQHSCRQCNRVIDLFPGYLVATNARHTHYVLYCPSCDHLVQVSDVPSSDLPVQCPDCSRDIPWNRGVASRNRYTCRHCNHEGRYPSEVREQGPPRHRLFGMEYSCPSCQKARGGRSFKTVDREDLDRFAQARTQLARLNLPCPTDRIPEGDETTRLHRWGYHYYRDLFNERQLLSLGLLLTRIREVPNDSVRHALATVFSDCLRYQNMLCRYDTYALKCQDIFSVHGFPVGLIQCENNVLGIKKVGSGAFRHFVAKYARAKAYCDSPFETVRKGGRKKLVHVAGEHIAAQFVDKPAELQGGRKALLHLGGVQDLALNASSVDGVFTDPPYFDNVQYAELMDFCYVWLKLLLDHEIEAFSAESTRSGDELTGNVTQGKDLAHYAEGLSRVFRSAAGVLREGRPFVFTYHHNDVRAYASIALALLDAGLTCTSVLAAPAEMAASLHINGTQSSVIDTVFVCRTGVPADAAAGVCRERADLIRALTRDRNELSRGEIVSSRGDLRCLGLGHLTQLVVRRLASSWSTHPTIEARLDAATAALVDLVARAELEIVVDEVLSQPIAGLPPGTTEVLQAGLFD